MMGAGLAISAYETADVIEFRDHAPVRLFVYMALRAVDADPRPTFYGGRESLAMALAVAPNLSGFKAVKNATRALLDRGLISVDLRGAPGRATRYALLNGNGSALSIDGERSTYPVATTGDAELAVSKSQRGTLSDPTGYAHRPERGPLSVPPRRKEDKEEEGRASATPNRSCRIHSTWEHSKPCRACANDRRAAEATPVARRESTMSPQVLDCGTGNHRRLNDGTCLICENVDPLWEVA